MRKCLLAFLLLTLSSSALATTLTPMYLDDLTAQSQTVVYGAVVAKRVEWDTAHRWIYTIYTVQPSQYLKGNLGAPFELREPGGVLGGIGMKVAGVPQFEVGEEAVFFVWTDPKGYHQVNGFEQGAVSIKTGASGAKVASRLIPLDTARSTAAITASQPTTSSMLSRLLDQIRLSIAKTSAGTGE
jgi:hypothetical protein